MAYLQCPIATLDFHPIISWKRSSLSPFFLQLDFPFSGPISLLLTKIRMRPKKKVALFSLPSRGSYRSPQKLTQVPCPQSPVARRPGGRASDLEGFWETSYEIRPHIWNLSCLCYDLLGRAGDRASSCDNLMPLVRTRCR